MRHAKVDSPHRRKGVPAVLVPVVSLTKDNIKDTVIKDGVYTVSRDLHRRSTRPPATRPASK